MRGSRFWSQKHLARLHWLPKTRWVTRALRTRKQRLLTGSSVVVLAAMLAVALLAQGILVHASSVRNNEGLSLDTNTAVGNFDGLGNSYSQTALSGLGFASGGTVTVQGIPFTWPTVAAGTNDNWQGANQIVSLPAVAAARLLGILGSSTGGLSSGKASITYTDNSVQTFTLTLSDWTLGGGQFAPAPGDVIAATTPYYNTHTGQQNTPSYLFYTSVGVNSNKTVKSLTLPATTTGGKIHVFSAGTGSPSSGSARNNEGLSLDTNTAVGNFDGLGNSYSQTALSGLGFTSGGTVTVQSTPFTWPTVAAGTNDNWASTAQTITLPATSGLALGFLGAATNGQASGTVGIHYKDGTTQAFTVTLSDWTLGGGKQPPAAGNVVAATLPYRNQHGGRQNTPSYLFYTEVALSAGKTLAFLTLPGTVSGGQLHIFSIGVRTTAAPGTGNWTQYLGNNADTSYNGGETTITPGNVANLKFKWGSSGNKAISGGAIEINGSVYWGDNSGYLHDNNVVNGVTIWKTALGVTTSDCGVVGIGSTANYQVINGVPTILASGGGNSAVGGGNDYVYALNANTGAIIWKTVVGNTAAGDTAWASPQVYNGSIYYGMASFGDCPLTRGRVYKINETTGAITGTFWTEPPNCTAGGIWGTPSIDNATGILYTATGTQSSCSGQPGDYGVSVLAINTATMTAISSWRIPNNQLIIDSDFGSAPTLFSAAINGVSTPMVGIANKNGWYYAFKRANIGAGPIWEDYIATNIGNTPAPYSGDGSISPSSFNGATLYMAGGFTTINGQSCNGSLRAVNPATGAYIWQVCLTNPNGWVLGAVMEIHGLVFVNSGNTVQAFNAATGAHLFTYTNPGTQFMWGPLAVANGQLYDSDMEGDFFALGLP